MKLQEIVQNHQSLFEILMEEGGEITSVETESIVDGWMKEITSDLALKADGYKYKMDTLEVTATQLKAEAEKIEKAAKTLQNISKSLKDRMKFAMQELGVDTIEGNKFKYKLQSVKPSVVITDEAALPAIYTRTKTEILPDKIAIGEALDQGIEVPGVKRVENFTIKTSIKKG